MSEKVFTWPEDSRTKVLDCTIFSVHESRCRSPKDNELRTYTVIESRDWAIVVPLLETPQGKRFVMVRQWRHGARDVCLEFPGGVFEPGEDPQAAAARELQEETGYKPGTMLKIGEFYPNPAIMANKAHFFLATDLINTGRQQLDVDELVEVELVAEDDIIKGMGTPPFSHALMGSALGLYLLRKP